MPLLVRVSDAARSWPGELELPATPLKWPGAPATTLESPRGTNMNGTLRVWWSAAGSLASRDATMLPRIVTTLPGPTTFVSTDGSAANAAADMVRVACTVAVPPTCTATVEGDTPMAAPRLALRTTCRSYVAAEVP